MEFTDKVNLPQGHELPTDTQGIHSSLEGAPAPISSASPGGEAEPLEALLDDPMGSPLPSLEGAPWFFDGPAPMDACDFVDNEIVIPSLDMAELLISSESSLPPDNSQVGLADFAPPMSSDEQPCLLPKTEQPGGEEAAYGTGKTVVGALIAARTYSNFKERVIATTTTNNAVAQFTDTLLGLDDFRHLDVLRYVSDSALVEGAPQTPIDLHNILKRLPEDFGHLLSQSAMDTCVRYKKGRELLERFLFNNDLAVDLSDAERDEYRIAERDLSDLTRDAIAVMFQ
ncbi:hypothetical protein GCK32_014135, partial [Trichostrongylus colubriformis]